VGPYEGGGRVEGGEAQYEWVLRNGREKEPITRYQCKPSKNQSQAPGYVLKGRTKNQGSNKVKPPFGGGTQDMPPNIGTDECERCNVGAPRQNIIPDTGGTEEKHCPVKTKDLEKSADAPGENQTRSISTPNRFWTHGPA